MAQIRVKAKESVDELIKIGVIGAAMHASRKFFSFETFFPKMSPDNFLIKNEGIAKVAIAAFAIPMVKNKWLKMALLGVGLEGGLKAIRRLTMKNGEYTLDPIGNAQQQYYTQEYNKMMGQFPGYGYTPAQVQAQTAAGVAGMGNHNYNMGNRSVAPYSGVPYAVGAMA